MKIKRRIMPENILLLVKTNCRRIKIIIYMDIIIYYSMSLI